MITLDMTKKGTSVLLSEQAFSSEDGILTLSVSLGTFSLTGKTVTAVFSPSTVETQPLAVTDGVIALPIDASYVRAGLNHIQLNIRGTSTLEQSPIMDWMVLPSLVSTISSGASEDIIAWLVGQINALNDLILPAVPTSQTVFAQTQTKTVQNTAAETSMFGTGVGSAIVPANHMTIGKTYRVTLKGLLSGTNGDQSTVRIKIGNVTLSVNTATLPAAMVNAVFTCVFDMTVRTIGATGSIIGGGYTLVSGGQGFSTSTMRGLTMSAAATLDTTVSNAIDVTYQWSVARTGNTVSITAATIEELR